MIYSWPLSFLLVSAAETTGEVTALFETIHQFAGKLFLSLRNRQENAGHLKRVLALLVKIGRGAKNEKYHYLLETYAQRAERRAERRGRFPVINTNCARAISINIAILVR
jgi:hypothetical protein